MSNISREAKILFALMLFAAAALLYLNLIWNGTSSGGAVPQSNDGVLSSEPVVTAPDVSTTEVAPEVTPSIGAETEVPSGSAALDGVTVDGVVTEEGAAADLTDSPAVAPATGAVDGVTVAPVAVDPINEDTVVTDAPAPVTAAPIGVSAPRDVVIAELPFLVTEPPTEEELAAQEAAAGDANQPAEQRLSVNPFSPILLQAVEAPSNVPTVTEVVVPDQPAGELPLVETAPLPAEADAPPLRTFTPPTPVASNLPRPLPGGTLSSVPSILRSAQPASGSALGGATLRLPNSATTGLPSTQQANTPVDDSLPGLLGVGSAGAAEATVCGPLAAGACDLSVYLRNQNVRFTGYVIGPVGVGVFRSNARPAPLVLPIGQNLPETDIVLTSLEGKQAEFTQGNEMQFLTLDFRR